VPICSSSSNLDHIFNRIFLFVPEHLFQNVFFLKHFILFSKQLLFLNSEYFFLEHLHLFWEHFILLCSIILFHFVLRTFHFCSRNNLHFFSVSFVQNNFSMEYFYMFQNNFKIQQYFCIRIGIHIWKLFVVVACATVLSCDMWVPVATATIYRAWLRLISSHRIKCFKLSSPAIRFVVAHQADGLYLACRLFLFDDSFLFLRLLFWNIMKCSKHLVMAKNMFGTFWIVSSIFIMFGTFQDGLELGFLNIWNNVEMFETFWIVCNILKCLLKFSRTEVFRNRNMMKCSTYSE